VFEQSLYYCSSNFLFDFIEQMKYPRNSKEVIVISIVEVEGVSKSQNFQISVNI
jgi:hypothetical protein